LDQTRNISGGQQLAITYKVWDKSPYGFCKMVFCFWGVRNTIRPFSHLSCTDFDHFGNVRRLSVCPIMQP